VAPQLIPLGELVTVPNGASSPAFVTVREKVVPDDAVKVAVTALAAFMVTEQPAVPEQAPLQPAKVEPGAGAAVRVTEVPLAKLAEQVAPQLMPAGRLVTDPLPVPALVTERAKVVPEVVPNVAVTAAAAFMVTVQPPVPEQAPLQPAKVAKEPAVAVRVTTVPLA
jgi:hypothetical protein